MDNLTFVQQVGKHFHFLESEFGFRITKESDSEPPSGTDGYVEYTSDSTIISIDSDRGAVAVRLYRIKDGPKFYLTPIDIHEYLSTSQAEKELLLSTDPKDLRKASELFNRVFLLNRPDWNSETQASEVKAEMRLAKFADWLQSHASLYLKGDFSDWPALYEYKILRTRADQLRRGMAETGYVSVRDPGGKHRLVKQSIFKDQLDHIEKLKEEFQK